MMAPAKFFEKSTMPFCGSTFVSSQVLVYMLGCFQDFHFIPWCVCWPPWQYYTLLINISYDSCWYLIQGYQTSLVWCLPGLSLSIHSFSAFLSFKFYPFSPAWLQTYAVSFAAYQWFSARYVCQNCVFLFPETWPT